MSNFKPRPAKDQQKTSKTVFCWSWFICGVAVLCEVSKVTRPARPAKWHIQALEIFSCFRNFFNSPIYYFAGLAGLENKKALKPP